MESLKTFQAQFMNNLMSPKNTHDPKRWTIYNHNWLFGHIKALSLTYPVCNRLVGDSFFEAMAKDYVQSNFSTYFSLNAYGANFSEFIQHFSPASSLAYLADVARMEWIVHKVFIGPSNQIMNLSKISEIIDQLDKYPKVIISLIQNGHLLKSKYPIHKIWETNQENFEGDDLVNLNEGGVRLFIWRPELDLQIDILEKTEWDLLLKIQEQNNTGKSNLC